jgi:HSP20 family protein
MAPGPSVVAIWRNGTRHWIPSAKKTGMSSHNFFTDVKTLRDRARRHIEQGAITFGYKADREVVIRLLNELGRQAIPFHSAQGGTDMTTETPQAPATQTPVQQAEQPAEGQARGQVHSYLEDVDQWFDDMRRQWLQPLFPMPGRSWLETAFPPAGRLPRVDLVDRDEEFLVRAELPGVSKDNLEVSLQENTVLLRAASQSEETEERGQYFRRETSRGEFQRVIRLPGPVVGEQARANFRDCILELVLPKQPGTRRRSIPVE